MDRLTRKGQDFENDFCLGCDCGYYGEPYGCNSPDGGCESYHYFTQLADRLAEYEDTGLSPAEVAELKFKIERLRAKVIAYEKSGLFPDEVVELAQAKRDGRLVVLPCKVGDTAYYYIDDDELASPYVGEFTVKGIQILSDGFYLSDGDCWDKIGTQFAYLTREEAEKALKERENNA